MGEKQRIRRISTRFLPFFKTVALTVYCAIMGFILHRFVSDMSDWPFLVQVASYGYIFYLLANMLRRIRYVEYDDEFLYVKRRGHELLIPLENIRDIDLRTFGGVYRVDLLYEDALGSYFYFKPSLVYPLNFRSKDRLVDDLRARVERAKKNRQYIPHSALGS